MVHARHLPKAPRLRRSQTRGQAFPLFPALLVALLSCSPKADVEQDSEYTFLEFPWSTESPDPLTPLCEEASDPDGADDKIFIHCPLEGESFAPVGLTPPDEIIIAAYNVERGHRADRHIELWSSGEVPTPDILLLSELDRGCDRTGKKHLARYYAKRLQMNYVFAVEFVELNRQTDGSHLAECEHGNAILSRFPLGNAKALRHPKQVPWFDKDEPRLGGRVAVAADVQIGDSLLHLYSVHFESSISEDPRDAQALHIAEAGLTQPFPVIVGGDFNSGLLAIELKIGGEIDQTARQFTELEYVDAHHSLSPLDRITEPEHSFILDLLMSRPTSLHSPRVGAPEVWDGLSDHRPIWATHTLTPPP